ncbi:MAG: DUF5131 family protein [Anaerolineae bacterium]
MMQPSAIGWCDYSGGNLNFVTGCTPVSAGCKNCYARAIYDRFGRDFTPTCHQDKLDRLYHAKSPEFSPKRGAPHKPMAFVCDTGDIFHPSIPDDFIALVFAMMVLRQDVTWLVLTKRPERIKQALWLMDGSLYPHIWLGVTVENQAAADERIPMLQKSWSGRKFVSVEPMLEPIYLRTPDFSDRGLGPGWISGTGKAGNAAGWDTLSWVICGAESGRNRRYFLASWACNLWEQCREVNVPYFGKQDSALKPGRPLYIYGQEIHEYPS